MKASALIVTFNGISTVAPLLVELTALLHEGVLEQVVVVDNGSADGTRQLVERWSESDHRCVAILSETNLGFPAAVNAGLRRVSAPVVALLNPDLSQIRPGLVSCIATIYSDESIGVCGPRLMTPSGRMQVEAARGLPGLGHISLQVVGASGVANWRSRRRLAKRDRPVDAHALSGAFMVMRTDLLRRLGGLDERLFMYLEDVALCQQIRAQNLRVLCLPQVARHACGTSRRSLRGAAHREMDCLIGEVPWLLARDEGRQLKAAAISIMVFALGMTYVVSPTRSTKTGRVLIEWALSPKPRYVGWRPSFAGSPATDA